MSSPPTYPGTPAWVKTAGKIVAVLAVLLVAAMIFSGGEHGPWRHLSFEANPSAATGSDNAPAAASQASAVPPASGN